MLTVLIDENAVAVTNETADANDSGADDFQFLPNPANSPDAIYFMADHQFRILAINVGTAATTTIPIVWEYFNGASYVPVPGVQDNTSAFTKTGTRTVSWDAPSDMSSTTVDFFSGYVVRARVTDTITVGTVALGTQAWYEPGVWRFFNAGDILPNSDLEYSLVFGIDPALQPQWVPYFPGLGGATTTDAAALEPGSADYTIEFSAFLDTTPTGASRHLMLKGSTNYIRMSSTTAGEINVNFTHVPPNCTFTLTGLTDAEHTVRVDVLTGSGTCEGYVDDVLNATSSVGVLHLDNANSWQWVAGGSVKYVNSIDLTIGGTQTLLYQINASTTAIILQDRAGTAQNAVPSWAAFPTSTVGALGALVSGDIPDILPPTDPGTIITIASTTAPFVTTTVAIQGTGFPGAEFITARATEQNVPVGFYWLIIAGTLTLLAFMGALVTTKNLWVAVIVGGVIIGVFVSPQLGILSAWSLVFYAFMSAVVLLGGRSAGQV